MRAEAEPPRIEVTRALRVLEEAVYALSTAKTKDERQAIQTTLTNAGPDLAVLAMVDRGAWAKRIAELGSMPGTRGWLATVKKYVDTLVNDLRPSPSRRNGLPQIQVSNRQGIDVLEESWRAILKANDPPELYVRGTDLVRLRRAANRAVISLCGEPDIQARLLRCASWLSVSETDGRVTNAGPPPQYIAKDMLVEPSMMLPKLESVVYGPVWAKDGTLLWEPGYHAKAAVWYEADEPLLRIQMTVEEAKRRVDEWLIDFPLQGDASKIHALALFLTPFVRRMIDGPTPIHLIEAAKEGTGKTKLADTLLIPALGRVPQHSPLSEDEPERQKKITSMLAAGAQVAFFDNVTGMLISPSIDIAVTSVEWTDRVLGGSVEITVPVNCVWVVTGNNLEASADTARRILPSRLVREEDVPADFNKFTHENIEAWTMLHRNELVSVAVTFVENWMANGREKASKRLGSFEAYCDVVGGILEAAGYKGWLGNIEEFRDNANPEAAEWAEFVKRWAADRNALEGDKFYTSTDLWKFTEGSDKRVELFPWMGAKSGTDKGKAMALGKAMAKKKDAVIGGKKIVSKKENGSYVYRLVPIEKKPEAVAADVVPVAPPSVRASAVVPDIDPGYSSWPNDDEDDGPLF